MDSVQPSPTLSPSGGASAPNPAKLQKVAREFESQLLAELLHHMHFNAGMLPGSEESGANEQYQNMATQAVADAMAANGGIGIANSIMTQLHKTTAGS